MGRLAMWVNRWRYRRENRRVRWMWRRLTPEAQAACLVQYIAASPRLRRQLRQALKPSGKGEGS